MLLIQQARSIGLVRSGNRDEVTSRLNGLVQLGAFVGVRQNGAGGGWVEAIRGANFWVPKFWVVEHGHPSASDRADPTVSALDRGLVAVTG